MSTKSLLNQNIKNIANTHSHTARKRSKATKSRYSKYKNISASSFLSSDLMFRGSKFEKAFNNLSLGIMRNYNEVNRKYDQLMLSYEWDWLKQYFNKKY